MTHRRLNLPEVTATGDRRASLEALRQTIADAIADDPPDRDLAALSRQLIAVMAAIDALPDPAVPSRVDELIAQRARRGAAS